MQLISSFKMLHTAFHANLQFIISPRKSLGLLTSFMPGRNQAEKGQRKMVSVSGQ